MTEKKKKTQKLARGISGQAINRKTAKRGKDTVAKNPEAKSNFRAAFMKNLMLKKKELEGLVYGLMETQKGYDGQSTAGDFIDEFDDAQREISSQSNYILIERKIKELQKIELLIERVPKEKRFGLCEECGKPIPRERLLIIPESSLCVSCQRELEKTSQLKSLMPSSTVYAVGGRDLAWADSLVRDDEPPKAVKAHLDGYSITDLDESESDSGQ